MTAEERAGPGLVAIVWTLPIAAATKFFTGDAEAGPEPHKPREGDRCWRWPRRHSPARGAWYWCVAVCDKPAATAAAPAAAPAAASDQSYRFGLYEHLSSRQKESYKQFAQKMNKEFDISAKDLHNAFLLGIFGLMARVADGGKPAKSVLLLYSYRETHIEKYEQYPQRDFHGTPKRCGCARFASSPSILPLPTYTTLGSYPSPYPYPEARAIPSRRSPSCTPSWRSLASTRTASPASTCT